MQKGRDVTQRLLVYQSLWAMERRRPDGREWSLSEKLSMIRSAGFDGCGVRFIDPPFAREVTGFLRAHGMTWQAQCYPQSVDDLKPVLALVQELGADHLNLQADVRFTADLSHYLVGREFAWPVAAENHAKIHRILDNSWGLHGRVASREQIQVQFNFPKHKDW